MSNHLRGSRRLKVINNWLNGKEDDEWEVFPSRTEGKYIVRPRKESLTKPSNENNIEVKNEETQEESNEVEAEEPKPIIKPKAKPRVKAPPSNTPIYDPTINIEILNQLKLLGEEIKQKREKKEQKQMIKNVVQKQMMKSRQIYPYTQPTYIQEPNEPIEQSIEEPINEPPVNVPMLRRRNNIFSDMI